MPSYLDTILAQAGSSQKRSSRRRGNIMDLLAQATPPAQAATPGAGGVAGPHSMGDGHNHGSQAGVDKLNAQFSQSLNRLIADAPGQVKIGSGYRSIAEQQVLYNRWMNKVPGQAKAAKPGSSNHNFGLAADLTFQSPAVRSWVHANAGRYGLRFPMSYEPWHIEPLNAKAMRGK